MGARKIAYVNPEMLVWARSQTPFDTVDKLHEVEMQIKSDDLMRWENGLDYPSINQAKILAKQYKLPFAAFYLPCPPSRQIKSYAKRRTITGHPERELSISLWKEIQDFIAIRNTAIENMSYIKQTYSSLPKIDSTDNIEDIGRKVREFIGYRPPFKNKSAYNNKAFNYFRKLFEENGILVFQINDVEISEVRGISIYHKELPIIGITAKDHENAKVFSLFHELAHLLLKTSESYCLVDYGDNGEEEKYCDEIAAEILLPKVSFIKVAKETYLKYGSWNDSCISEVASKFGVSLLSVLRRLEETELMDSDEYWARFNVMRSRYNKYKRERTDKTPHIKYVYRYINKNGTLYPKIIMTAHANGSLSYGEVCSILSVNPKTLREISEVLYK